MSKTKLIATFLIALAVLFAQVGTAAAAPQAQDGTTLNSTIQNITTDVDANGDTVVLVTVDEGLGNTQVFQFSLEDAVNLEFVTVNPNTNEITINEDLYGTTANFDPTLATLVEQPVEETNHPISVLLAAFFDLDASEIDGYHEDGYGFGVIAQALWMAKGEDGTDAELAGLILDAKKSGDYTEVYQALYPDSSLEDAPTNWGQFKKLTKKHNLGEVVSGKAEKTTDNTASDQSTQDDNKGKGKSNNEKGNNNNKGEDKGKGKNK